MPVCLHSPRHFGVYNWTIQDSNARTWALGALVLELYFCSVLGSHGSCSSVLLAGAEEAAGPKARVNGPVASGGGGGGGAN